MYVYDLTSKTNQLLCTTCVAPSLSADGRFVAWQSRELGLNFKQIFVADIPSVTNRLVSVNQAGTAPGAGICSSPVISADGRYVVFKSQASDLVANDTNGWSDIFVRDLAAGTTLLVSVNAQGTGAGNLLSSDPVMGADGRTVLFQSFASDLVEGDWNNTKDVFLLKLATVDGNLPFLTLISLDSGKATLIWQAVAGNKYRVQFKNDLNDATWSELPDLVTANGPQASATDLTANASNLRFYRVVLAP